MDGIVAGVLMCVVCVCVMFWLVVCHLPNTHASRTAAELMTPKRWQHRSMSRRAIAGEPRRRRLGCLVQGTKREDRHHHTT